MSFLAPFPFFTSDPHTIVGAPDNDEGVSLDSTLLEDYILTDANRGWTSVETVLIRFDTSFTPSGRFPVHFTKPVRDLNYTVKMGYDAAVCVQKYESWIIEAYNTSTGSASALRIIGGGGNSTSLSPSGNIQGAPIANTRYLNTTGKWPAFGVAREISIKQMEKLTTGQGTPYVPSPAVGPRRCLAPPTTLFLTSTTGCFFHRRHWSWA